MSLTGLFVPLVTPFTPTDELASEALESLARAVLDDGAAGIVALGTTGEPATLTADERRRVVDICAGVCVQRGAHLIVGAGSNSTTASAELLAHVDPRATAALTVVPYYTRPSEDGVVEHFRRLAAASPVPLIVYNVPYRTGTSLGANALGRLARIPNVAGFKHAVGGIDDATVAFLSTMPTGCAVLAGDDLYVAPLLALGAFGAIMASANVATGAYVDMVTTWRDGPSDHARRLHNRLLPLSRALFAEPNPAVIKAVLSAHGRIPSPRVRLPLLPTGPQATTSALEAAESISFGEAASVVGSLA